MTNDQANAVITAAASTQTSLAEALTIAANVFSQGYKTDQDANTVAIASGVASGLQQAVSEATATLQSQIDTLTADAATKDGLIASLQADNAAKDATIADLQGQVVALTPA